MISWYFLSQFSNQSKNYIKFNFQYWSTSTFKVTQLPLPKISKHQTEEQYKGSANRCELENYGNPLLYPVSVRDFPSPELGVFCIYIVGFISKSALVLFTLLRASKHHFQKAPCYIWPYYVQYNTRRVNGYFWSTFKIARVSNRCYVFTFFSWYCTKKWTLCAIVHWTTMITLFSYDLY